MACVRRSDQTRRQIPESGVYLVLRIQVSDMQSIQLVGWYSELPHGEMSGPSLSKRDAIDVADRAQISEYLDAGKVVAIAAVNVVDVIDGLTVIDRELRTLTDGQFVWPSDLSYYVSKYGSSLPESFLSHVRRSGQPPPVTDDQVYDVVDFLMSRWN